MCTLSDLCAFLYKHIDKDMKFAYIDRVINLSSLKNANLVFAKQSNSSATYSKEHVEN